MSCRVCCMFCDHFVSCRVSYVFCNHFELSLLCILNCHQTRWQAIGTYRSDASSVAFHTLCWLLEFGQSTTVLTVRVQSVNHSVVCQSSVNQPLCWLSELCQSATVLTVKAVSVLHHRPPSLPSPLLAFFRCFWWCFFFFFKPSPCWCNAVGKLENGKWSPFAW